jgi:hypothetical protein
MKETIEPDTLADAVTKVLSAIASFDVVPLQSRLAYTEAEAAKLIGVEPHVLRDERLRGNVRGKKVGRRVFYRREDLAEFLSA